MHGGTRGYLDGYRSGYGYPDGYPSGWSDTSTKRHNRGGNVGGVSGPFDVDEDYDVDVSDACSDEEYADYCDFVSDMTDEDWELERTGKYLADSPKIPGAGFESSISENLRSRASVARRHLVGRRRVEWNARHAAVWMSRRGRDEAMSVEDHRDYAYFRDDVNRHEAALQMQTELIERQLRRAAQEETSHAARVSLIALANRRAVAHDHRVRLQDLVDASHRQTSATAPPCGIREVHTLTAAPSAPPLALVGR